MRYLWQELDVNQILEVLHSHALLVKRGEVFENFQESLSVSFKKIREEFCKRFVVNIF